VWNVLSAKGYATSAPYNNAAWRAKPIFLQSFEINSLKRLSELSAAPLVYLLDDAPDPETGKPLRDIVSVEYLKEIKPFVTVMAPWKGLLYNVTGAKGQQKLESTGLTARFKQQGLVVHTYTIRNEPQFVLPTCGADVTCEFEFLFKFEGLDGALDDYPATLVQWVKKELLMMQIFPGSP
jgi:glycerophosphoryl diester phosphodiesterase